MSSTYINPALPSMIRGLYDADLRERSIRGMLDLAADLVQELIDLREQADREPSADRPEYPAIQGAVTAESRGKTHSADREHEGSLRGIE